MAMENKRITQLSTERLNLTSGDYVMVDDENNGSAKYRLDRLKETDTTLSVSGMAADAAATGQAIGDEATARVNAVSAEAEARAAAVTAEAQARAAADTTLGNDVDDLKSAMSDAETAIEQLDEQKADINGTYEDMTVGTAESVLSGKYALESVPYHFRKTGGDASVGSRLKEKLVGGTVAFNQIQKNTISRTTNGITFTFDNGKLNVSGVATGDAYWLYNSETLKFDFYENHIYLVDVGNNNYALTSLHKFYITTSPNKNINVPQTILKFTSSTKAALMFFVAPNDDFSTPVDYYPQIFDLTQMFGTAIADYIYSLEQTTAGAGVALFRKLFPKQYYPFNAGELLSVSGLVSHDEIGFNQWDEKTESGYWDKNTGIFTPSQNWKCSKNYIPCIPNTTYYADISNLPTGSTPLQIIYYDADKNYIQWHGSSIVNTTFTTPNNAYFMTFYASVNVFDGDICINLSDPSKNGQYEPYKKHSYPLDSSLTLRGVPKLVDKKIKFDGDWYESEGKKTERYGIVDLGTLNWSKHSTQEFFYTSALSNVRTPASNWTVTDWIITPKFFPAAYQAIYNGTADKAIAVHSSGALWVHDSSYSDADAFKTAMSGVKLVYEKATPTITDAQPFVNPQICDKYGTEEYVSTSIVPVGHETEYFEDVVAKVDGLPWDLSMIAPIDNGTTATRAYTTGQYFLHNDQFCKAKTNIASGATFTLNTNYEVTTVANELYTALH